MKVLKSAIIILLVFTACKSSKTTIDANAIAKKMSSKKVAKKHVANNFDKETIDAKLRVKFKNNKENQSFSVRMKIKKDEVIYLKGSKIISLFKAKITPSKVSYYSPYAKNYFEGDYSLIKDFLGTDITFEELQNIFLGQAKIENKGRDYDVEIVDNQYKLSPEEQPALFDKFFFVNASHFKLDKHSLINESKNQRLDISYPKYLQKDGEVFPENIVLNVKENNKFTNLNITVKSVNFNTDLSMPFKIPSGYKKLNF